MTTRLLIAALLISALACGPRPIEEPPIVGESVYLPIRDYRRDYPQDGDGACAHPAVLRAPKQCHDGDTFPGPIRYPGDDPWPSEWVEGVSKGYRCGVYEPDHSYICQDGNWERVTRRTSGCMWTDKDMESAKTDKRLAEWMAKCN